MLDPEMRGWAIVVTNGMRLAGLVRQPADGPRVLDQALEFLPVQTAFNEAVSTGQQDDKGNPLMATVTRVRITGWQLAEPLAYPSIAGHPLPIPEGAWVLPVSEYMSQADMNMLAKGIDSFHAAKRKRESERLIAGVQ